MGTHFDICLHIPALLIYTRPLGIHMEEEEGGREGRDIKDLARERYMEGGREGGREGDTCGWMEEENTYFSSVFILLIR